VQNLSIRKIKILKALNS